jgi:hypothetical protein
MAPISSVSSLPSMSLEIQQKLIQFLSEQGLTISNLIVNNPLSENYENLEEFLRYFYPLFNGTVMRSLIDYALKERDQKLALGENENDLLGSWGIIIDVFKKITLEKRENSSVMLQELCQIGRNGNEKEQKERIERKLEEYRRDKRIDSVFIDLVTSSYEDCKEMHGNHEILTILKIINNLLTLEKNYYSNFIAQAKNQSQISSQSEKIGNDIVEEEFDQRDLIAAGEMLQNLLASCKGDAKKLKTIVVHNIRSR